MAEYTGISWADATFNPWIGCAKVSPGCANCYAETLVHGRMGRAGTWGEDGTRERTADAYWRRPFRWNRLADQGLLPGGAPNLDGHRPRIFCASLADVFEPRPELAPWRQDLFENVIAATPNLDWMLLTKRPEEALAWLTAFYDRSHEAFGHAAGASGSWQPLPNVWIGVSIENLRHTYRADVLRQIPAAVRFISAEPLLGSLYGGFTGDNRTRSDATGDADDVQSAGASGPGSIPGPSTFDENETASQGTLIGDTPPDRPFVADDAGPSRDPRPARPSRQGGPGDPRLRAPLELDGIDWVIVGGESGGHGSRPMHPAWAREIRDHVLSVSIADEPVDPSRLRPAFHFKQWGSWRVDTTGVTYPSSMVLWLLPNGRIVEHPSTDPAAVRAGDSIVRMVYAGRNPKDGGKLLDLVEWCEFPDSAAVLVPA